MEAKINSIKCPDCGLEINVDEELTALFDKKYKKEFLEKLMTEQKHFNQIEADLKAQCEYLDSLKAEMTALFEKAEKQGFANENEIKNIDND